MEALQVHECGLNFLCIAMFSSDFTREGLKAIEDRQEYPGEAGMGNNFLPYSLKTQENMYKRLV